MRVDRKPEQSAVVAIFIVADYTFDRHTCLSFVQHDRMVIDDAVLVQHVRVHTDRVGAASRIDPRVKEVPGRIQTH
ncbi:hypothetical protein R69746_08713 [Paraburkholderia aspalathi]|nr:hypothetical protein R69746_08713 [Paraburkholderia aspalathi]